MSWNHEVAREHNPAVAALAQVRADLEHARAAGASYKRQRDEVRAEIERLRARETGLLADLERRYVEALNAVLAAPVDRESDHDVDRWRGHAEAYRQTCELIRREAGLPAAKYRAASWRREHCVYEPDQFRRRAN